MKIQSAKFNTLSIARNYSFRTVKSSLIILGCDGLFWVVSLADAARLIRAGYEVAE